MTEPFCRTEPPSAAARAFVEAVKAGDAACLDVLLTSDAEVRTQIDEPWFSFDRPAIVTAARDHAVIDVLLEHGADINARSQWNAGSFGVLDGLDPDEAAYLIERGAVVDVHAAAGLGDLTRLRELVEASPELVHALGGDGQRPLHFARGLEGIDFLLDQGADLEARDIDHGATAAQYAVEGDMAKCRHLVERGAVVDIFMACALGEQSLVDSVMLREPECLSSRVGSCPHTRVTEQGDGHIYKWRLRGAGTPLETARVFGHEELFQELLRQSPLVERFVAACWFAEEETAKGILVQNPAILRSLPQSEQAMMARAAWDHRTDTVRLLLDLGFDPHLKGAEESTPLDRAAFHGLVDIIELLLDRDPDPPLSTLNAYDSTPLGTCVYGCVHGWHEAADYPAAVEALLKAGGRYADSWMTGIEDVDAMLRRYPQNCVL